jgi:hypothetical protein
MDEVIFTVGDFTLKTKERNEEDTTYQTLVVKTDGLAKKHVVEVRLDWVFFKLEGRERQLYDNVYVSHGMRGQTDTLTDTQEYIEVLQQALEFAKRTEQYCRENGWWSEE